VGGQDELVFDGGSVLVDANGQTQYRAPAYQEDLFAVQLNLVGDNLVVPEQTISPIPSNLEAVYQALVLGMRDYVNKNRFKGVVLGLSGGIDSALTLAMAVDALGADRVEAVMMPFRYTSDLSKNDAADQASRMGVRYSSIGIEPMYEAFMGALAEEFAGTKRDTTEENLQARCRGVLLMAISNKKGYLVLTTGNKSEMAVGYSTLYGDMAGGFDALKDVPKTLVFALAKYRNTLGEVIPTTVITRPPSAELAPDQKDEDSLPPYDILDQILAHYVEQDFSAEAIIAQGFARDQVERAVRLVDVNEYKRRQAPVGIRITQRGFGRDRRYPITSGWKMGS
jgi:NAD+ synthase (glutamine-hydrolysing)